jgi:hypothetical protein
VAASASTAQVSGLGCPARLRWRASVFWFTFAGYSLVPGAGPRRDLDLAVYGVVKMTPGGPGSGYRGLGWEPKLAFGALAQAG